MFRTVGMKVEIEQFQFIRRGQIRQCVPWQGLQLRSADRHETAERHAASGFHRDLRLHRLQQTQVVDLFANNPTVMIKHKRLLGMSAVVPTEAYEIPLGKGNILRPGTDVTIVAYARMANEALIAAAELAKEGIECEIIDPRTLQPLDTDLIVDSAKKTNRVVVVHEAVRFGGLGGEIASQIQELAFDYLDAPVTRIGAPFSPVPFSPALEQHYIPDAKTILAGVRDIMQRNVIRG